MISPLSIIQNSSQGLADRRKVTFADEVGFGRICLNSDWDFCLSGAEQNEVVTLPHGPQLTDLNANDLWLGVCEYRRTLVIPADMKERCIWLRFEGVMQKAEVILDGERIAQHAGGYLPFVVDLSNRLICGRDYVLTVRVDNRYDAEVPPGKPLELLDFSWHGGIYRSVSLEVRNKLHVTDEALADSKGGGGIFVTYPEVSDALAVVSVQTHVANEAAFERKFCLEYTLTKNGETIVQYAASEAKLTAKTAQHFSDSLRIVDPELWSPDTPHLYTLSVSVLEGERLLDRRYLSLGVRRFSFSRSKGLQINGKNYRLTGTNRHQEYPYIGYAASDEAQYRDALKIKNSGFDYVRLSHYPQASAFLDACDALGIVVMNCIPGWQFFGGEAFQDACEQAARGLVRRDRNHPCVLLWELSLNETEMSEAFMQRMHVAGHEEYPGDQFYTCGWMGCFDVYLRSRQHGGLHTYQNGEVALVIAEYGDWEYHAADDGFEQHMRVRLMDRRFSSRQFRGDGEAALLQQVHNFMEAFNENVTTPAVACGQWAFCDYTRGNQTRRAAMGVRDIFRLPKYGHYFYRSQRTASQQNLPWDAGYMVYIASNWLPDSTLRVTVFSNAEEVELLLNGVSVSREKPSISKHTQSLLHPPFVFCVPEFVAGTLSAIAYAGDERVATHSVSTAMAPASLKIIPDLEGLAISISGKDTFAVHVHVLDAKGNLVSNASLPITLHCGEGGRLLDASELLYCEAGIASTMVGSMPGASPIVLAAKCAGLPDSETVIER